MVGEEFEDTSSTQKRLVTSFTEIFEERCPVYMAMGMTYDEYWNGNPEMARFVRQTHKLRKETVNEQLWLQGIYVMRALQAVWPMFNALAGPDAEGRTYPEKPIPLTEEQAKQDEKDKEKQSMLELQAYLEGIIASQNKQDKEEGEHE